MLFEYGRFEFELQKPSPLRAAMFAPFFMRYNDEVRSVRPDVIDRVRNLLAITERSAEMTAEIEKLTDIYLREKERMIITFISRMDRFSSETLISFVCKDIIKSWNLDLAITPESIALIPPYVFIQLLEQIGTFLLAGGTSDINFLPKKSQSLPEGKTESIT